MPRIWRRRHPDPPPVVRNGLSQSAAPAGADSAVRISRVRADPERKLLNAVIPPFRLPHWRTDRTDNLKIKTESRFRASTPPDRQPAILNSRPAPTLRNAKLNLHSADSSIGPTADVRRRRYLEGKCRSRAGIVDFVPPCHTVNHAICVGGLEAGSSKRYRAHEKVRVSAIFGADPGGQFDVHALFCSPAGFALGTIPHAVD